MSEDAKEQGYDSLKSKILIPFILAPAGSRRASLREAMLTIGTLLLFFGGLGAIAATTPMGAGALITQATLVQMGWSISIFTVIAFIGAALIIRNR